jgi:DNA-binding winged helix-turn-helix (wHTH) protein/tetratricopeptide (TPR) repeat protein
VQSERYRIADLVMDVATYSVTRDGTEVLLPRLSFDLLLALTRRAPTVVSGDELAAAVWPEAAVSDETLIQRVALLRRSLGDDAREPRYIRSVRGRGYGLVPSVAHDPPVGPGATRRRPVGWTAGALAGLFVAVLGGLLLTIRHPIASEVRAPEVRTEATSADELVARADEYLSRHREADNEIAMDLYRLALDEAPEHPGALAGLSFGLSQGVTKFNHPAAERAMALSLAERALAVAPQSAAAHHAHALALDSQGWLGEALKEYSRATELDPGRLWAVSSAAYVLFVQGRLAEALEANLRVVESGTLTPYIEVQMGTTLAALGFEGPAVVWFERALRLRPDNVFAALAFARVRLSGGRLREAEQLARGALERGIERPELHGILGRIAELEGDRAAAKDSYRQALEMNPRLDDARVRLTILEMEESAGDTGSLAACREMSRIFSEWRLSGDQSPDNAFLEAVLDAALGDEAAAIAALDSAIELGYRDADGLLLDPALARLRRGEGLLARVERIRLLVDAERTKVVEADWLPGGLLSP